MGDTVRKRRIYINEAFRPQRVSGQQRYATEIADRLPADFVRLRPGGFWAASRLRTWLWVQTVLPWRSRRGVLVSMTARAPLWHPRHVLVVHDLFVLEHPEWFSRLYRLTHAPLLRLQLRTARRLVAVSDPVARQLDGAGRAGKAVVAPNAPSAVFAQHSPDDIGRVTARGLEPGGYLLTVGSLEPRKNLGRLAEAYATLSPEHRARLPLVVAGAGADIYGSTAITWPDGAILTGYVSDDELRALYAHSAAVVFVSLAEGFGLPLVEASTAGAPRLVVSDLEVFRWICREAATYVDPTDVLSIAGALGSAGDTPALHAALDPGRFTWEQSGASVAAVARSATGSRSMRGSTAGGDVGSAVTAGIPPRVADHRELVAVVLASAGRPRLLAEVIGDLERQTVPHRLVVSVPGDESLPPEGVPDHATVVYDKGLTAQRNAGLDAVPDADFVFFFDDDAVVREDFLERGVEFFGRHPDVVGITGRVLLDGASSDEISRDDAEAAVRGSALQEPSPTRRWRPTRELYGCNFAYRVSHSGGERFDSRLPLYSWLEDHDFARRLMRHGRLAKVADCVIVHRGVKSGGRVAHTRLGYSQMMNPLYLHHVGSFPLWLAAREIIPRCGKNLVLSVGGPESEWRRQRLRGNAIAMADAARGRFSPERMLEF